MKTYQKHLLDKSLNKTDFKIRKKLIKEAENINEELKEIKEEENRELFILSRLIKLLKNNI